MPAPPSITTGLLGRCGIVAALASGAALAATGCSGDGDEASAPAAQTVTVTQKASEPETKPETSTTANEPPSGVAATLVDRNADLSLDDQAGAGRRVRVQEVAISGGTGHVAIYAASGRLLGARKISATVRSTTVPLSRPVPRTSELLAVLYGDDGNGAFSEADPRVIDEDGELLDDTFDYRLLR